MHPLALRPHWAATGYAERGVHLRLGRLLPSPEERLTERLTNVSHPSVQKPMRRLRDVL